MRVAGTYIPYFLHNQKNVKMDNLLTHLWEEMSDYNSCKIYHRLKNRGMKYFVIDPNIGTVGRVGQGNESLFHRFFAKLNTDESKILTPGAISMLVKLHQDGYLKLTYTNNIGAKYAFSLSDQELKQEFGEMTPEDIILLRAKLAVAKFFISQENQELIMHILSLFQQRMATPEGLEDLANLLHKEIDGKKIMKTLPQLTQKGIIDQLSEDEKAVLSIFIPLASGQLPPQWLIQQMQQSILGSSQIIALELK